MRMYKNLYVGENAKKNRKKIIRKIRNNRFQIGIFVLTLPANRHNIMDIYPSYILLQPYYKKADLFIIGIAKGKDEAINLMQKIIMDSYHATGDYHIEGFLLP